MTTTDDHTTWPAGSARRRPIGALLTVAILLAGAVAGAAVPRTLGLAEAIELALGSDEQLAQAREAVTGAEARVMAAGADRLPHLDLAGTYTRNLKKPAFFLPADFGNAFGGAAQVEMGGDWDLQGAATLTFNLWTAGRLSSAHGAATAALASSRWQEALVRDVVSYSVRAAYYDALLAAIEVDIADRALALAEESLRVTAAAHEEGTASRFDLLRAQVELANREAPAVQARNARELALANLRRVCGLEPDIALQLTDSLAEVPAPADLVTLVARMRERSPELKALTHTIQAAEMAVRLARAGRGPVVQLQGQYAVQGQWDDDVFPGDDETATSASAALAVSIPIFDGFAAKADIHGRQAELRQARLEYERVERERELAVRQARTSLENARLALEGRHEAVGLAEEALRLAEVRLQNGLATPLERLDADTALTEARVQLAEALHQCNIASANLSLAVGGREPFDATIEENQR
jgi:outer membrane protein TolC